MPSTSAPEHHVFVDFENVPSVDLTPIADLPVTVTVLIGGAQNKLDTNLALQIHAHAAKIRPVRLAASGRNALDLTLAYYLGRAVLERAATEFHIVSQDKDFDPLIAHLRSQHLQISRSESFATLPFLASSKPAIPTKERRAAQKKPAPASKPAADDRTDRVFARLSNPLNANRPSTEVTLRAYLRSTLGKESSEQKVEAVLGELIAKRVLSVDARGRVVYARAS
jgi:hypothetical protein